MIIETMLLSLFLGKVRGGKIKNLENLYINGWYLFVISFSIEITTLLIISRGGNTLSKSLEGYFFFIHILIYLTLIIGLAMNWGIMGLRIVLFGSTLNFLPILLNNGRIEAQGTHKELLNKSRTYRKLYKLELRK